MRDAIYGYQSNEGWDACKTFWAADEKWLAEQYNKLKCPTSKTLPI